MGAGQPEPPAAGLTPGPERRALEWLFALLAAGSVVPLWSVQFPPLQDLPQHLAAIRVLHSYDDPGYGFASLFELHPLRTQYLAYYFAADLLCHLFSLRVANLILLSAAVVATPYATRALGRALGADGAGAWLAFALTYNAHLMLGFFNFVAGIPLALFGLTLALRLRRTGTRRQAVTLAFVSAVAFCTHVVPFAFLALGTGLIALGGSLRASLLRLLPLLPAGVLSLLWFWGSPAGQATVAAAGGSRAGVRPDFRPAAAALSELPMWLTAMFDPRRDTRLLWAWLAVLVAAAGLSLWPRLRAPTFDRLAARLRLRLCLLPALAVLLYFVAPSGYAWIWPIAPRFALLAAVFALPLLPTLVASLHRTLAALGLGLGAAHVLFAAQAFVGFEREVGQLERALESIPRGHKVAGLIFDRGSRHVRFSPFIHAVAYYQAERGGAVMFTFADFPQSPFSFRAEGRPPRVRPRWEWLPGRVNPAVDLGYYDYVLIRGGPGRIARQRQHYRRRFRSRHWSVWQRIREGSGTIEHDGGGE